MFLCIFQDFAVLKIGHPGGDPGPVVGPQIWQENTVRKLTDTEAIEQAHLEWKAIEKKVNAEIASQERLIMKEMHLGWGPWGAYLSPAQSQPNLAWVPLVHQH